MLKWCCRPAPSAPNYCNCRRRAGALSRQSGLPLVHDLPGVGANLQDHLQLRMVYRLSGARTLNTLVGSPWGRC